MNHNQTYRFWRSAGQCLIGGIAVALVTFVCFRLNVSITTAALLYLIVVVLASLTGSFVLSVVVSIIAILCLDYFFTEPLFHIDATLHNPLNLVALITFLGTALVITSLMAKGRKSFQETQALKDQLRLVIDTIPALAWSAVPDGSRDFLNQRWLEYTGLSLEEGLGRGWQAAIHPEDRARLVDEWRAALAAGEPLETEERVRRADGEYRWFLLRAVPLRDKLGNIVKWYGTSTDIEDRKQAEEIRTAQARQADIRADVSAALSKPAHSGEILRGSAEAIVRHLDAAFARIWTLNKEKNMLELQASAGMYTHLDGPHSRIQVGKLKIGLIAQEKKPHLTNDVLNDPRVSDKAWAQNEGMVSFAGYPLIVQDRVVGVMAMFARQRLSAATLDTLGSVADSIAQGIERKQAEEVLREQAGLLDLTHDTVFVRDMNDVITYWNRAAAELYGWTREEAVGKVSHQLMQTIFPAPLEKITAELNSTGRWEGELIHARRDGTQVVVSSRWALQLDERGKPIGVLETNNDITERKQAEEALHKAQAELAHVTRVATLGEMTASIAHEINQPLAAVVNNASACLRWLAGQAPNLEEARQSAAFVIADGHRAGEIIGRIRALVNKAPPQKDGVNINETILEVIALTRNEVHGNHVSLETQLADDVPLILGDRIQLQQVILNLIINAIEAMSEVGEGPRELLVGSGKDESKGVRVTVRDSGPGLDPESLDHLFTAFFTTKPQGMGMGLAISRSIIEAHGGRLWATVNEHRGATFQFTLPHYGRTLS